MEKHEVKTFNSNNGARGTIRLSEMFPESGLQWHIEYALLE